jgi:hypothetical protein
MMEPTTAQWVQHAVNELFVAFVNKSGYAELTADVPIAATSRLQHIHLRLCGLK